MELQTTFTLDNSANYLQMFAHLSKKYVVNFGFELATIEKQQIIHNILAKDMSSRKQLTVLVLN